MGATTTDELLAKVEICEQILARVKARQPALPDEVLGAIERACEEFRAELERRAA